MIAVLQSTLLIYIHIYTTLTPQIKGFNGTINPLPRHRQGYIKIYSVAMVTTGISAMATSQIFYLLHIILCNNLAIRAC